MHTFTKSSNGNFIFLMCFAFEMGFVFHMGVCNRYEVLAHCLPYAALETVCMLKRIWSGIRHEMGVSGWYANKSFSSAGRLGWEWLAESGCSLASQVQCLEWLHLLPSADLDVWTTEICGRNLLSVDVEIACGRMAPRVRGCVLLNAVVTL